ncbi:elongation factor P hydroxylase [Larsenimonas suaedae]|uniref:Elongation factor P hydroxylase n=1 Tax=Larsenimonas suaedae TaxID=1851019 RepID=A0ABU1GUA4_9GAMM|nr:elongation factor P hydroxylase [Larsenimonas suaedae]MCM2970904.1 elongation factor P hydroxylase [Larsenimonas suaedae]MDR5895613.1 elongation factor P hydroxylase [Larsenimonas suaedae]
MKHDPTELMALFDGLFADTFQTRLVFGADEPLYLPANTSCTYHRIMFAHGYFSSALHEISHWCIAGAERRLKEDYGYWYIPDGRDASQQHAFEQVEVAPQALESLLCAACDHPFNVSVDNLDGDAEIDRYAFEAKVRARAERYLHEGLAPRPRALCNALTALYQQQTPLDQAIEHGRAALFSIQS